MRIVPCHDGGIIIVPAPSVQVDADGVVGQNLSVLDLRGKILVRIGVLQFVVVVRRCRAGIVIFREVPERRVDRAALPADRVAFVVSGDEFAVVIDDIEIVFFIRLVPDTGVDHDLIAVVHFVCVSGNTDLFRRIADKVIQVQIGRCCKLQPAVAAGSRTAVEIGVIRAAGARQRTARARKLVVAQMTACTACDGDFAVFIRRIDQLRGVAVDAQIFSNAVHVDRDMIGLFAARMEAPHRQVAVRDQQIALEIKRIQMQLDRFARKSGAG